VNYIFGAAERDGPAGPAPINTPRVRKSMTRPSPVALPFGSEKDMPSPGAGAGAASPGFGGGAATTPGGRHGSTPRTVGLTPPFKSDATAHFPSRAEGLPSAPPAPPGETVAITLASVAKMSLPDLREALRARGLSPAGGLTALQERMTDFLKGLPSDTPAFVPVDSGMDWPSADDVDAGSRPTQARRSIRISATSGTGGGNSSLGYILGAGGA
jgi:hypothetical protein